MTDLNIVTIATSELLNFLDYQLAHEPARRPVLPTLFSAELLNFLDYQLAHEPARRPVLPTLFSASKKTVWEEQWGGFSIRHLFVFYLLLRRIGNPPHCFHALSHAPVSPSPT